MQPYRCSDAKLAFNKNAPSDILYETMDRWQPEAAEPVALCGEKGVEGSGNSVRLHSEAAIRNATFDRFVGTQKDRLRTY